MKLYNDIKKYSKLKTWTVLPFSILALISTIFVLTIIIISLFIEVSQGIFYLVMSCLIIGILTPPIILILSEYKRKDLINPTDYNVLEYINILSQNNLSGVFLVSDIVDLFFAMLNQYYRTFFIEKNSKIDSIVNSLMHITRENRYTSSDLVKFSYRSPEQFSELFKYIKIQIVENEEVLAIQVQNLIENKYYEMLKSENNNENKNKIVLSTKYLYEIVKVLFFIVGIVFLFLKNNSFFFITIALVLLLLEILDKKKNSE